MMRSLIAYTVLYAAVVGATALPQKQQRTAPQLVKLPSPDEASILRHDLYGYSIEPSSVYQYASSPIASNFLAALGAIIGKQPPIRIGGTTADEITLVPTVNLPSHYNSSDNGSSGGNNDPASITVSPAWYATWKDYFPAGTDFVYTLNFHNTSAHWATALAEADQALASLGHALKRFELGNEVDHWISEGWRNASWGTVPYTAQWRALRGEVEKRPRFGQYRPQFQAAVFADPPDVPDQNAELDDFSIVNLTEKAGLVNNDGSISSYAVHLYPQSNCDAARKARLSLDLLSNHSVLYTNVSQYVAQQQAAQRVGKAPLVFGETNSVSCGGKAGVSDTFGAALWSLDYALMAASLSIEQVYFHLGDQSEYSAFTPLAYTYMNQSLTAGVRANAYAHLMMARMLEGTGGNHERMFIQAVPDANTSDFSGYAVHDAANKLAAALILDMGVWNSSQGLSNPSTLSTVQGAGPISMGERPQRDVAVATSWEAGTKVSAVRMEGPGTNAKTGVSVGGQTIDAVTGKLDGDLGSEALEVDEDGVVEVSLQRAEAVLLKLCKSTRNCSSA